MQPEILEGDCLNLLPTLAAESVDAIVTDPPYGLGFMGKRWDALPPGREVAQELLRVAKPGAHLVAFGGTRTYHRLTCALEDAGWEIRDCLAWLYGSGFPKSLNLKGEWEGWGTALKPAFEPMVLARKPLVGTVAESAERFGTGAINVDACRVQTIYPRPWRRAIDSDLRVRTTLQTKSGSTAPDTTKGRWPPNVLLGHAACCEEECGPCCPVKVLDEQSGESKTPEIVSRGRSRGTAADFTPRKELQMAPCHGDSGGASRFFPRFRYEAKASTSERGDENRHPTVKPIALMQWLCKLVTPPGGVILDPFLGSGTTMIAALRAGFRCTGIERDPEYVKLARRRVEEDAPLFLRGTTDAA